MLDHDLYRDMKAQRGLRIVFRIRQDGVKEYYLGLDIDLKEAWTTDRDAAIRYRRVPNNCNSELV